MAGLVPACRRPKTNPRQTPTWLEDAILTIRLRCGWGAERIAQELNHWGLGPVTHNAVWGVLERRAKKVPLVRRNRKSGFRYQRETPNDLWHMDVKGPLHFRGVGPVYGMAILDDRSRFCVGAMLAPNRRMDTAISVLNGAVENWGAPRQLMSDNGSEFVGVGATAGDTRFLRRLDALEVDHLAIRLRTPETNGKIERFWLSLEQELLMRVEISSLTQGQEALLLWVAEYNFNRRHSALDYLTPAQVYCPEAGDPGVPADLQAVMPYLLSLKEAHKDTL
jgi:transposase InsO family protein